VVAAAAVHHRLALLLVVAVLVATGTLTHQSRLVVVGQQKRR
jgi:hypothetical protein